MKILILGALLSIPFSAFAQPVAPPDLYTRDVTPPTSYAQIMRDVDPLVAFFILGVGVFIYLLPTFIAYHRDHHNKGAIFLLNLLLGWLVIGWIVALIWSATSVNKVQDENNAKVTSDGVMIDNTDTKVCPYCAETIKKAAMVCRYCGKDLDTGTK